MEIKKSHDLLSANPRAGKVSDIIQPESWGLKSRSTNIHRQKKMDISAQVERVNSPFFHIFVLVKPSADWMMPTHTGEGTLSSSLSLPIQMPISSRDTLTDIPTNILWATLGIPYPSQIHT